MALKMAHPEFCLTLNTSTGVCVPVAVIGHACFRKHTHKTTGWALVSSNDRSCFQNSHSLPIPVTLVSLLDSLLLRLFALCSLFPEYYSPSEIRESFTKNVGFEQMSLKEIENLDEEREYFR